MLFDLDGTLADTIGLIVASYNHAFREVMGTERDEAEIRAWIGRPLLESFARVAPEHAEELDRVYREWNIEHTLDLLRDYPGLSEVLVDLGDAGVRTGVVTSKRRETALLALRGVGIEGLIPLLATLEDTERHKPLPDPLLRRIPARRRPPRLCLRRRRRGHRGCPRGRDGRDRRHLGRRSARRPRGRTSRRRRGLGTRAAGGPGSRDTVLAA